MAIFIDFKNERMEATFREGVEAVIGLAIPYAFSLGRAMRDIEDRTLTPGQKRRILERDDYCCRYCYGPADQVDHIVPWAFVHDNEPDNLVASCWLCNLIGADKVFKTFSRKADYIVSKRYDYIKKHPIPLWTKPELESLGHALKEKIKMEVAILPNDHERERVKRMLMMEGFRVITGKHWVPRPEERWLRTKGS